mmetsp:Transcript_5968/g.12496  ORF Transcript_5968/g.12496 Transcript_5968/m.12496 type:complete len:87 (+) Transcript_5968:91-351(+)
MKLFLLLTAIVPLFLYYNHLEETALSCDMLEIAELEAYVLEWGTVAFIDEMEVVFDAAIADGIDRTNLRNIEVQKTRINALRALLG